MEADVGVVEADVGIVGPGLLSRHILLYAHK
jgi:hypothetical protein